MTLHLLHCQPDLAALATWATRHGVLSPDGDYGYALHGLLSAAFGERAPKPFRFMGTRQGLLAYTSNDIATLRDDASLATPDVARALGLDRLDARQFPHQFPVGKTLQFEVRGRPVVRARDGRERDAFLHSLETDVSGGVKSEHGAMAARGTVYCEWLAKQFAVGNAAQIQRCSMELFQLTRVLRRSRKGGGGQIQGVNGPDAVFSGQLQVTDSDAFARLLVRGIGRHRAFGFGMLLLRPA